MSKAKYPPSGVKLIEAAKQRRFRHALNRAVIALVVGFFVAYAAAELCSWYLAR